MGRRIGGIAKKGKTGVVRIVDVKTPPKTARNIFQYLLPHVPKKEKIEVWDACSGDGILGNAFCEAVNWGSDIFVHFSEKTAGDNLFAVKESFFDIVICNPPWVPVEYAEKIFHHLVSRLKPDGVLFFVINNTFCYQGYGRAVNLKFQKYYFLPRYAFKESGHALLDAGIMVYHRDGMMPDKAAARSPFIPIQRPVKSPVRGKR